MIRTDAHHVSDHFGVPMLSGLLFFICETTSMIGMLWEENSDALDIMICAGFYSMAYLMLECSHRIGPKFAILAVRCHEQAPRNQVLASAFLHAPIKIDVRICMSSCC
mmetsp:Transcript_26026/g.71684  ORF Transcript_26026/g.71684 Transcript_26026/m.71684 type:complete len:108 (+) Transcript_26026:65-388(+)